MREWNLQVLASGRSTVYMRLQHVHTVYILFCTPSSTRFRPNSFVSSDMA